jgi:two-component system, chemotaxis family, sensor kinase CheA
MTFGDMDSLRQIFFQECDEQLAELESGLLEIENGGTDPELVNAVFRAVHSIKGGAGAFALEDLVRFAHIFETVLDEIRKGLLSTAPPVIEALLRAADVLADLVRIARDGGNLDQPRISTVGDELASFTTTPGDASGDAAQADDSVEELDFQPLTVAVPGLDAIPAEPQPEPEPAVAEFSIAFKPHASLYANANEPTVLLRELGRLGEITVECDTSALPDLGELDPEGAYLSWSIVLKTTEDEDTVRSVFEFVDGDCELTIVSDQAASGPSDDDIEALLRQVRSDDAADQPAETPRATDDTDIDDLVARTIAELATETDSVTHRGTVARAASKTELPVAPAAELAPDAQEPPPAPTPDRAKPDKAAPAAEAQQTIRVELDRVDRLMNLVGELVINQAMLSQRLLEEGHARSTEVASGLDEFEQLTRDIQEGVMAIRAQPVKSVFQRMPRLVREVAAATSKKVRLVTEGEGTEVDKTVIERLADPLTHMIRNAIDHGLEKPQDRVAAGKREEGLVRLSATHRSGRIVIDIADDGAGINRPRVRKIAEDKGLIPPNATLADDEVDNLIFLPGFSTASAISDISGRGVGMDVVKRSIQALGGRVSITSRPGEGSTFTLSLPLTLAVLYGMVVTVADQTLVVPLTSIVETLQPKPAAVHSFGGDARVIEIRDKFIPLVDVGRELGYRSNPADPAEGVAILVESDGGALSALLVDGIQGQRQVVIKSLEANYGRVPGVAAATILGNGRVALIVDVDAVVEGSRNASTGPEPILALAG